MTSYFGAWNWLQDVYQQMENLQGENDYLRRQHEEMAGNAHLQQKRIATLRNQNRTLVEWRNQAMEQEKQLQTQTKTKNERIRQLQEENLQYKKAISGSNLAFNQLSDTTIQGKMDALFYAVRDWAIDSVRHDKLIFRSLNEPMVEWLNNQIPGGKQATSTHEVNALIAIVFKGLVGSLKQGWVFGVVVSKKSGSSAAATANHLNTLIEGIPGLAAERKKQWVLLTNELVSKDEPAVQASQNAFTEAIVQFTEKALGQDVGDLQNPMTEKLRSAIRPHIHVVQALYQQEAEYSMGMLRAVKDGSRCTLDPAVMDEVNGEEEGILQASFFPVVYKHHVTEDGSKVDKIVICKAKVMVNS